MTWTRDRLATHLLFVHAAKPSYIAFTASHAPSPSLHTVGVSHCTPLHRSSLWDQASAPSAEQANMRLAGLAHELQVRRHAAESTGLARIRRPHNDPPHLRTIPHRSLTTQTKRQRGRSTCTSDHQTSNPAQARSAGPLITPPLPSGDAGGYGRVHRSKTADPRVRFRHCVCAEEDVQWNGRWWVCVSWRGRYLWAEAGGQCSAGVRNETSSVGKWPPAV